MNLEQQLTPLPQARRLDELGFKGESYYWHNHSYNTWEEVAWDWSKPYIPMDFWDVEDWQIRDGESFPAYSVPELMDALPYVIKEDWYLTIEKTIDGYIVSYVARYGDGECEYISSTNLAEALSDMMIRLIEQGLYIVNNE